MSTNVLSLKKFFIVGLVAFTALSISACTNHEKSKEKAVGSMIQETSPTDRAAALTDLMSTTLNLNESQRAQVGALNLDYSTRFSVLMASTNKKIDKKAEFTRLSAEKEAKLKGMLDDSQIKAYDANKADLLDTYRMM
ncbi:MAG: hypothetical protein E6Q85_06660 [Thiothrix sp.]|jgi:type IV pilus biogenesis protein CpaD/CtpE|nr:MAG: hypothetical protein E6Q85_06660 [Thiothrix sp.]